MSTSKKIKEKNILKEPAPAYQVGNSSCLQVRSVFREIGNSKGVILSKKIMEAAGISANEVYIEAIKGEIRIRPIDKQTVNTDLSTWGKQFKAALKDVHEPEGDLFNAMKNKFDEEEW